MNSKYEGLLSELDVIKNVESDAVYIVLRMDHLSLTALCVEGTVSRIISWRIETFSLVLDRSSWERNGSQFL